MKIQDLETTCQSIAPDYELLLITVKDKFEVETKWLLPAEPAGNGDIETIALMHVRFSQGTTRRN